jgi:hypothetical protein
MPLVVVPVRDDAACVQAVIAGRTAAAVAR